MELRIRNNVYKMLSHRNLSVPFLRGSRLRNFVIEIAFRLINYGERVKMLSVCFALTDCLHIVASNMAFEFARI
jgi:hypothetical protein